MISYGATCQIISTDLNMHRRMIAEILSDFSKEEVDRGEVGHVGHLGYLRRGLGRGLGQPGKKKFLVSRICYCQASSCCATIQLGPLPKVTMDEDLLSYCEM